MSEKPTILIVDDTPANLQLLAGLLKDQYRVKVANNGIKALSLAEASPPDLVLLDVMMPEMDGFEVCRRLKDNFITQDIPVLFLTAKNSPEDEEMGFSVGAVDFIHKPISPPVVNARVRTHLKIKQWGDMMADKNEWLEAEVQRRLNEVHKMQEASMMVMVSLAEFRDECTGLHVVRTQKYVEMLAVELAKQHKYRDILTPDVIEMWGKSAQLHDIGKIAIPDAILLKPGKLTDEEFEIMKTHTTRGYDILKQAGGYMESEDDGSNFLNCSMEIALNHHEKWNGMGYPNGLAGEEIPLSARLMAVADVYDALRSARPYKSAMPHEKALEILMKDAGSHFDPQVVEAFVRISKKCEEVSIEMMDEIVNEDDVSKHVI